MNTQETKERLRRLDLAKYYCFLRIEKCNDLKGQEKLKGKRFWRKLRNSLKAEIEKLEQ